MHIRSAHDARMVVSFALGCGVLGVGCGGDGSACDAGYGLAADGKCYPIYDPNNPPWDEPSTDSGALEGEDGSSGGSGGGSGSGSGGAEGAGSADGGSGDGGSADGGGGDGGGTPAPPRVEGTYGIAAGASIASGTEFWIGVWPGDIGEEIPSSDPIGEASLSVLPAGETSGFQVELTAIPADGADVWVGAVLVQGDGDVSDDPYVVWAANPGFVTPVDPQVGVELIIP